MTKSELRDLIFSLLYENMQGDPNNDTPEAFVGVQGDDAIVVMQAGGSLGVRVVDAVVGG